MMTFFKSTLPLLLALIGAIPAAAQSIAYVANPTAGTISTVALASLAAGASVNVTPSSAPKGLALARSLGVVYVAVPASNSIAVLDAVSLATTTSIKVATSPHSLVVAPNSAFVYVTNNGAGTVSVIDTSTNKVTATISVGSQPRGIAVSKDGLRVYVANYGDGTVSIISTVTNNVSSTIKLGVTGPIDLLASDDGNYLFVASDTGHSFSVVSLLFSSVLKTVDLGSAALAIATQPKTNGIYVAIQAGAVQRFDPVSFVPSGVVARFTNPAGLAFSADSQIGYVLDSGAGTITSFSTTRLNQLFSATLAAGVGAISLPNTIAEPGFWYNSSQLGRGYAIEQSGGNIFAGYYVYDSGGNATWFVTFCTLTGTSCSGPMLASKGGVTLTSTTNNHVANGSGGTATFNFTTPTGATLTWPGGIINLQRYAFAGANVAAGTAGSPETGWWYDANYIGNGWFIEVQRNASSVNTMFLTGYMYRPDGSPVWYSATINPTTSNNYSGQLTETAGGGAYTTAGGAPPTSMVNRATVTLQFTSSTHATMTLSTGETFNLTRFTF